MSLYQLMKVLLYHLMLHLQKILMRYKFKHHGHQRSEKVENLLLLVLWVLRPINWQS